jgi:cell division septation protein DedD
MRNNETGEYELVVGNRQLLSGFFIVVILCAVAFAMGYVVGQNSPRTAKLAADQTTPAGVAQDARPQPASPAAPPASLPAQPEAPPAPAETAQASSGSSSAATEAPPQPTTQPAHDATPPPAPVPAAVSAADAPPGTCWQVLSTRNEESARDLVQTLKDKGFPAALSPGPNNLTRVLVGPYTDTAAMGRAKTALENAGFHPVRK